MSNKKTFEVGLVMAGAVSAGAYTAGVMDYLLLALDEWYAEKQKHNTTIPDHNICIKVMTGASAGGMTTAISTVEMLRRAGNPAAQASDYQSLVYKAWVKDIDISKLLQTDDLKDGTVKSLLDSTVLDDIAASVIDEKNPPKWNALPYVEKELKLFLTLSNLRGLPYNVKLDGQTGLPHGMSDHADYQYVKISADTPPSEWIKLRNAAIATGAFPVGLASRLIERDLDEYRERIHKDGRDISGLLKVDNDENKPYNFVAVDGGLLNNEPIELARSVWTKVSEEAKQEINEYDEYLEAKKTSEAMAAACPYALIIVDPFPDQVDIGKNAIPEDTSLMSIIGPILGAMRSQSLFKVDELIRAADREETNTFLIAPIRYNDTNKLAMSAIACGFFSGFGGFLSEKFRQHDYELGKRNCQRFLQRYFVLPLDKAEKEGWDIKEEYVITEQQVIDKSGKVINEGGKFYPIIPIIKGSRSATEQGANNKWPDYTRAQSKKLKEGMNKRARAIMKTVLPFGWIDNGIVTAVIIILLLFAFAGEFVKAAQEQCNCMIIINGLKNSYILILQLVFFLIAVALFVLRWAKRSFTKKLVDAAHDTIIKHLKNWGIKVS